MTMPPYYRAVALDYDGTLTLTGRPAPALLDVLAEARRSGLALVLVTGRVLPQLQALFPDVTERFDLVVAENGAVLARNGAPDQPLAEPVDPRLAAALRGRGLPIERGQVLVAALARDAAAVEEEVARSGTEVVLVRNRDALMLLPSGVSKGSGLFHALGELGISFHSTVSAGDAENDHSLLAVSELGVAVANAVPALAEHADLVLDLPAGEGIASLLRGPVIAGERIVHSRRWRVALGTAADGTPATLPASQLDVVIAGGSGSGKSFLAGLFVERLVGLGYSVCILDPEGDHSALAEVRGVTLVGAGTTPPPPPELRRLLRSRFSSVVVALDGLAPEGRRRYVREALAELHRERLVSGLPHWIVLDEAQETLTAEPGHELGRELTGRGHCLVTWQPERLSPRVVGTLDAAVVLPGLRPEQSRALLERVGAAGDVAGVAGDGERARLLVRGAAPIAFEPGARRRPHVRHWHKYLTRSLPPDRWFLFREGGVPNGHVAGNVADMHRELAHADLSVVGHHLLHGDFSDWLGATLKDGQLAASVRDLEVAARQRGTVGEEDRSLLLAAIERRYGETPG